ncbi:MAG: MerR family transcriptional regulator [Clostridiales bacterium]|nr:MerR family transcriptional regulator [Clostridiales bacterium]
MLRIGDFSKLSRISIRMLRHYDEIGLLAPESIDELTGYRYYSEAQLPLANRIHALKDMGFSLSVVGEILKTYNDSQALKDYLLLKQAELKELAEKTSRQLLILETTINRIGKDDNVMEYSNSIAVFHDKEYKEHDPDVEIQLPVQGSYQNTENVEFKIVPAQLVASVTFKGSYSNLTAVNQAIANWVRDNRYDFNGAMFNIYCVSPAQTQDMDELVTEVCFPVKKL